MTPSIQTPFLRPPPSFLRSQTEPPLQPISASVLANRARRRPRGLTENWVRQHTSADAERERLAWLSDNDKEDQEHGYSSLSSEEEEDEEELEQEQYAFGQRTPTLKSFLERKGRRQEENEGETSRGHSRLQSAETITPQIIGSKKEGNKQGKRDRSGFSMTSNGTYETALQAEEGEGGSVMRSVSQDTSRRVSIVSLDKPLPTPPKEEVEDGAIQEPVNDTWTAAALPAVSSQLLNIPEVKIDEAVAEPIEPPKPTPSPAPPTPRLKTKVPWGRKNISILLPLDKDRGKPGFSPKALTPEQVQKMVQEWAQMGYNVDGFNIDYDDTNDAASQGQSRVMWPDAADVIQDRAARQFRISIPDKSEWDAYVQELQEAKLRALGVSLGSEDPAPTPPAGPALSRVASSQYPGLTTSAAGSHTTKASGMFSPPLPVSAGGTPFVGATASSVAQQMLGKLHTTRQSISFNGGEHPFGSAFSQQNSPVAWSPQHMLYNGIRDRAASVNNYGGFSPSSPLNPLGQDGYFPNDAAFQRQRNGSLITQTLFGQQFSQPASRNSPRLQELQIDDHSRVNTPGIQQYTPKHRMNLSDSLQKEIEDAEYHLEEQFERQLEHDDYSPHSDKPAGTPEVPPGFGNMTQGYHQDGLMLHHPQPHGNSHSLSQRQFATGSPALAAFGQQQLGQMSATHSASGTPHQRTDSMATNPWAEEPVEEEKPKLPPRKTTLSKLNVGAPAFVFNPGKAVEFKPSAPEFKPKALSQAFNPTATFVPGRPAFTFPPAAPVAEVAAFSSLTSPVSPPAPTAFTTPQKASPIVPFGSGKINAAAPEFTPGGSRSSFSFSTVRPDAPVFKPMFSGDEGETPVRKSIFGNIVLNSPEIAKQPKKNKAIPIIKPLIDEENGAEDKDGRIGPGESRFKRSKADNVDGDSVPLFAEPILESMPLQETSRQQSPPKQSVDFDKVNTLLSDAENAYISPARSPQSPAKSSPKTRKRFEDSIDFGTTAWEPFEFRDINTAKEFSTALPPGITETPFKVFDEESEPSRAAATPVSNTSEEKPKHERQKSSLSALAKPFTFGQPWSEAEKSAPVSPAKSVKSNVPEVEHVEEPEMPAREPMTSPETLRKRGLAASRWADSSPSPEQTSEDEADGEGIQEPIDSFEEGEVSEGETFVSELDQPDQEPSQLQSPFRRDATPDIQTHHVDSESERAASPTFEEIDDVMRYMNEDANHGVVRHLDHLTHEVPFFRGTTPELTLQMPDSHPETSPIRLQPAHMRSDAPSPSPRAQRRYVESSLDNYGQPGYRLEDPFAHHSPIQRMAIQYGMDPNSPIHHLNSAHSMAPSDWDSVLDQDDEAKFAARAQFFDSHVNDIVGGILAEKLDPLEQVLATIQQSLSLMGSVSGRRRATRSVSRSIEESDADDEDDDEVVVRRPARDMSPKKDRKMEQIRAIVMDAFAAQQSRPVTRADQFSDEVLYALQDLRNQVAESKATDADRFAEDVKNVRVVEAMGSLQEQVRRFTDINFQGEKLRNIVEDVAERRIAHASGEKIASLEAQLAEMAAKLKAADEKIELETEKRRQAEDSDAKAQRLWDISSAEEFRLRAELEERAKKLQVLGETLGSRYSAEDEVRMREAIHDKDEKIMSLEEARALAAHRAGVLETTLQTNQKTMSGLEYRLAAQEKELTENRREVEQWRFQAEKANQIAQEKRAERDVANQEAATMRRTVGSLRLQMQESLRVRENFRVKLSQLQERMAAASHEVNQENAQRIKQQAILSARQEVLDARLEAEAITRERLMKEIERLEQGEREGMRAVADNKKLMSIVEQLENKLNEAEKRVLRYKREYEAESEGNLAEIERVKTFMQVEVDMAKTDLVEAEQEVEKYKREFEEARESGLSEVQRTRKYMQAEIEQANNQVNLVRQELEDQVLRLRAEVDHVKLEADTARERHEMLLEAAVANHKKEVNELIQKDEDKLEDIATRHEHTLSNTTEDAQRAEQHLLERLSLSSARTEHLQDRVAHLEEKLQIAQDAAAAAVAAAKSRPAISTTTSATAEPAQREKISPQALRESIMVLQEQLQHREQTIESLEAEIARLDPEAPATIAKLQSEINWLREMTEVRKADLQDIIDLCGHTRIDGQGIRNAATRLKAALTMEEMERERMANGGGLRLPNIAVNLRDAVVSTPRVQQVSGVMAAAWGNWKKSREGSGADTPGRSQSPSVVGHAVGGAQSFLAGFMTPPSGSVVGKQGARGRSPAPAHGRAHESFKDVGRRLPPAHREHNRPSPRKEMGRVKGKGRMDSMSSHLSRSTLQSQGSLVSYDPIAPSESYRSEHSGRSDRTETMQRGRGGFVVEAPGTPEMMRRGSYDKDAREEDYSDAGFYDDDESTVDEAMFGANLGR